MNRTVQECFDHVAKHLLAQGRRASSRGGECYYRRGDLKCAIGTGIDDEHYRSELEHKMCDTDKVVEAVGASGFGALYSVSRPVDRGRVPRTLAHRLQMLHDARHPEVWGQELAQLAGEFNLTMPEVG